MLILIVILLVVILAVNMSPSKVKGGPSPTVSQSDVTLKEIEEIPAFNHIIYAVVDSYDGYIDFPSHATYPSKLLEYMEEWTVSADRKIAGRTYLMNKKLAGQECDWLDFNGNQYCVLP